MDDDLELSTLAYQFFLCNRAFRKYLRWDWLLYGLLLTKQVKPVEVADQDRRLLPC